MGHMKTHELQWLRIHSARFWLKLGEADRALRELEALPAGAWNQPPAVRARAAALAQLDRLNPSFETDLRQTG
jgi:hypothetical protein